MYSLSTYNNNRFYEAAKLKVDPLSDKYPNMSPYAYCMNNPVKLIDLNREFPGVRYLFFQGTVEIGAGFALSANQLSGIANDQRGVTCFVMSSVNYVFNQNIDEGSQNASLYLGGEIGASVGMAYNWNADSFIDALSDMSASMSLGVKTGNIWVSEEY